MKAITIRDLRRQLAAKERLLNTLQKSRKKVLKKLATIDAEIAEINGGIAAKAAPKRATKAGSKRKRNRMNLTDAIAGVLAKVSKPMRVKDVQNAVTKAGYKSASKQFYTIVATALRDPKKFKRAGRGRYNLA